MWCAECDKRRGPLRRSTLGGSTAVSAGLASGAVLRDPRQHLGQLGERLAAEHLERLGYTIVARNYRTRWGELDLIVHDPGHLVFCEVKTRRLGTRSPLESIRENKQRQVRRMAAAWLAEVTDRPRGADLRFDAIGVTIDGAGRLVALEHLEAAF